MLLWPLLMMMVLLSKVSRLVLLRFETRSGRRVASASASLAFGLGTFGIRLFGPMWEEGRPLYMLRTRIKIVFERCSAKVHVV